MEKPAKETAAVPVTFFWDIKRFPVPEGYDARRVGPSIKQNLRKLGYTGPITITAIGVLTEVPLYILESLSSTGIAFKNLANSPRDALGIFIDFYPDAPSPANIMVLSAPPAFTLPIVETHISEIRNDGYYTTFLFAHPPALEDGDKCSETGKPSFWNCFVCRGIRGYGFQNFLTHLSTRHHKRMLSYWNSYAKPGDSESDSDSDSDVKAPIIVRRKILSENQGLFFRTMLQLRLTNESNYKKSRLTTESNYKKSRLTTESNYKKSRLTNESNYKKSTESNYKKSRLTNESNYKKSTESNYKKSRLTTESNYKQSTESNYKKSRLTTESK